MLSVPRASCLTVCQTPHPVCGSSHASPGARDSATVPAAHTMLVPVPPGSVRPERPEEPIVGQGGQGRALGPGDLHCPRLMTAAANVLLVALPEAKAEVDKSITLIITMFSFRISTICMYTSSGKGEKTQPRVPETGIVLWWVLHRPSFSWLCSSLPLLRHPPCPCAEAVFPPNACAAP